MTYDYKITVFTPTYNRAYIIENLYRSLCRQTYRDFEWLVVDDGSTDSTELLFQRLMGEADFPIQYYKKENGGKHTAINTGLSLAKGELFFTVDSDDWLTDDALHKILQWEQELPKNKKYCGFAGRLMDTKGNISGAKSEIRYLDGTTMDRYSIADGERAMIFYTSIHREYTYPVYPGESFMTEAIAWNRMAKDGYMFRFYNDVIWIYEYQPDGLTKAGNSLFVKNPMGYGLFIREKADILKLRGKSRFMLYYSFCCEMSNFYSCKQLSAFLDIPLYYVKSILWLHKLVGIGKKRK